MKLHLQCLLLSTLISLPLTGCSAGDTRGKAALETKPAQRIAPTIKQQNERRVDPIGLGFDYSTKNARLQAMGIPTPESSATYRAMSDSKLDSLAMSGDKLARTFWVERFATEALTLQRLRDADGNFPEGLEEKDAVSNIGRMAMYVSSLEQEPTNAMSGYLWGLYTAATIYRGTSDEPIVAGIRLAGLRGDDRAAEFERQFRSTRPDLDEAKIDMYFESGRRAMEMAAVPRNP